MNVSVFWTPGVSLEAMEEQIIKAAFKYYRQNKSATSASLGISVRTLENKLAKYQEQLEFAEQKKVEAKSRQEEFMRRQRGLPIAAGYYTGATPTPAELEHAGRAKEKSDKIDAAAREIAERRLANHATPQVVEQPKYVEPESARAIKKSKKSVSEEEEFLSSIK